MSSRFETILEGYQEARHSPFGAGSPMFKLFKDLQEAGRSASVMQAFPRIRVTAGAGMGVWARVPWLAFLDDRETTSIQKGVYVVYLFREDMSGVYLTLNQGVLTVVEDQGRAAGRRTLRTKGDTIRQNLSDLATSGFSCDDRIDLRTDGNLGLDYEAATIAYKFYPAGDVPEDDALFADLRVALQAYDRYVSSQVAAAREDVDPLDELKTRFVARFPDFTSFAPSAGRYWDEERRYKDELLTLFGSTITEAVFRGPQADPGAAYNAILKVLQSPLPSTKRPQNLISWRSLTFLKDLTGEEKVAFARGCGDLLFGREELSTRIDHFVPILAEVAEAHNTRAVPSLTRSLPTLLLMLQDPESQVYIRTTAVDALAERLTGEPLLEGFLSGAQYAKAQELYQRVYRRLEEWQWQPRDLIDAQGFVWTAQRPEREDSEDEPVGSPAVPPRVCDPNPDLMAACESWMGSVRESGLVFNDEAMLLRSLLASLATKRFVILTGLSGSGKTQLALRFGDWVGAKRTLAVAVRPDWTGSEALFGYEDALLPAHGGKRAWYVPQALEFMLQAAADPEYPYALILDEMNLAHVERYFADVLSGMESDKPCLPNLSQGSDGAWRLKDDQEKKIRVPRNLFVLGTVNVDETTYMFSPKVLDRANTFEFRVTTESLTDGVKPSSGSSGHDAAVEAFCAAAFDDTYQQRHAHPEVDTIREHLRQVHALLTSFDSEFGHRVFYEAIRYAAMLAAMGEKDPLVALDLQLYQKVLPRLHGARRRLDPVLSGLALFCHSLATPQEGAAQGQEFDPLSSSLTDARLPRSFGKIRRMMASLRMNQFASFTA
jgi:hypothetical protein